MSEADRADYEDPFQPPPCKPTILALHVEMSHADHDGDGIRIAVKAAPDPNYTGGQNLDRLHDFLSLKMEEYVAAE